MRGHWWGLVAILAATTLGVSAQPTSKTSSSSDSVTIPLILRQPTDAKPPEQKKTTPPPAKAEAKSPQDIIEETPAKPTPVAMQSTDRSPEVPLLGAPPAPTLDPALPTTPELFIPDLTAPLPPPKSQLAEPKPARATKSPPPVAVASPPPMPREKPAQRVETEFKPVDLATVQAAEGTARPKGRAVSMEPVEDVPNGPWPPRSTPKPRVDPVKPAPVEIRPVEEINSGALRADPDGKPPSFRCRVRDVTAFHDRTHVRCHNKVEGKVSYFAVDTNQPVAATVVTKALAAMQSGKPLTIAFAPDVDLNPPNCGPDCRRLIDIEN
jgi:hypothetical protein